jgi:hypothetical protein
MPKRRTSRTARKSLRFESLESRELLAQLNFGIPFSLGPGVNTAAIEEGPSTTADELSLVFWRKAANDLPSEILEATRTSIDAPFGNAVSAGAAVNVGGVSTHPYVSPDGLSLLFSKSDNGGMYQATRASRNEPFGSVTSLGDLLPGQPAHQPSPSADGLTLFFTAWDTAGEQNDIYQATRASLTSPWGNVVKLGAEINTVGYHDAMPSISSDGLRLLFNSNRPGGFGKYDLYVATRTSVDAPWQQAVNLGAQVNTAHDDKGPSISSNGSLLYFHSDRHGGSSAIDLYEDLYAVTVSYDVPAAPTISISDVTAIEGTDKLKLIDQFVAPGSGGLARPRVPMFGPDSNGDGVKELYVASADTDEVLRYDGSTGAFLDAFIPTGRGGLNGPADLEFGPDGRLYVSGFEGGHVLRYDGQTGAFLDQIASGLSGPLGLSFGKDGRLYVATQGNGVYRYDSLGLNLFVPAGRGGLTTARHALFGPDANSDGKDDLYVASADTRQVLRYDGSTGAFIDVFVTMNAPVAWMEFGPDGDLYVITQQQLTNTFDVRFNRFDTTTRTLLDTLSVGPANWAINFDSEGILYNTIGTDQSLYRYGPSSLAAFTVSLSSPSNSPVQVSYTTANGTATAGSDFVAASGTITFAPGQTSRTILVQTPDDAILEPNETFVVNLSSPVGGVIVDNQGVGTIIDNDAPTTKFYVVDDASQNRTFEYTTPGGLVESYNVASGNSAPRGAASNVAGDKVWVVDANRNVYVYNVSGGLVGSWTARTLAGNATVEGIATNGTDVWIVDARGDRVYRYAGAASRTSGSQFAASSIRLDSGNFSPKDIVTDGQHLWVVNDSSTDRVFKYTIAGALVGSWTIDSANKNPTGLTLDPVNPQHIWIVDSGTDRVYQYNGAASRTSGSQTAASSFALSPGNTNPQGIADPPTTLETVEARTTAFAQSPTSNLDVRQPAFKPRPRFSFATQTLSAENLSLLAQTDLATQPTTGSGRTLATKSEAIALDAALEDLDFSAWPELLIEL